MNPVAKPPVASTAPPVVAALYSIRFDEIYATLAPDTPSMAAAAAAEIRTSTHRQITEAVAAGKLLLEVKAALPHGATGGVLSAGQRALRDRWTALRIPFVIARSIEDVRKAFEIWGIETRETAQ